MGDRIIDKQSIPLGRANFAILEQFIGKGFNQTIHSAEIRSGEGIIFKTESRPMDFPADAVSQIFTDISASMTPFTDEELFAWIRNSSTNRQLVIAVHTPLLKVREFRSGNQTLISLRAPNRSYDIFYGPDEPEVQFLAEITNYAYESRDQTVVRRTL